MAGSSAFSKVEHTIGDSKHPSDELSRDLGRFFGVSADKMTQNMVEYQFHDSAPAYVYGPLQPSLLRSEKLREIAPDMLYLPLQSIHVAQALFHAVVALALEITQRKDITEEDLIECIELRQLGEKLQDIFDIIESHITKQEPSYQSLSNWQAGLDEVFEKLCEGRYGREEIQQSRDFLQGLKRSDKEQYARSRLLADQIDRKVDGIRLLSLDGERPGSISQLRILQEHVERGVVSEISSDAETITTHADGRQADVSTPPQTGDPPNNNIDVDFYQLRKSELIDGCPQEVQDSVRAVFDERIREQARRVIPQDQQDLIPATFSTLQDTQTVFNLIILQDPQWANIFLTQSPALVGGTVNRVLGTPNLQALLEDWDERDSIVTAVMGMAGPWLALQGLAAVGFTATGVLAGSLAAAWQASIGNVAAGSIFASFQSMGALGALTGPVGVAAVAVGGASYGIYKWATQPTPEERLVALLDSLLNDPVKWNGFWGTISL